MSLYQQLHQQLYGKIKWNLYKNIKEADAEFILQQKDYFIQMLQEDQHVKYIDVNWNNFKTNGHRYTFFDTDHDEPLEGAIYKFTSDVIGDSDLIECLCNCIKKSWSGIYELEKDYITLSFEIILFNAEKNDPIAIATRRNDAINKLRIAVSDMNTQAQLYKIETDHFVREQVEKRYQYLIHQKSFYKHIDKI